MPTHRPELRGMKPRYRVGDKLSASCCQASSQSDLEYQWKSNSLQSVPEVYPVWYMVQQFQELVSVFGKTLGSYRAKFDPQWSTATLKNNTVIESLHEPETGLQTALSSIVVVLHRDHFTEGGILKLKDKTVIEVRSLHEPETGLLTALSSIVVVLHRDHFTEGGRLKLKDKTVIEVRSLHEPETGLQTALSSIVVVLHRDHFTEGGRLKVRCTASMYTLYWQILCYVSSNVVITDVLQLKNKTVIAVRSLHEPETGLQTALFSIVVVLHRDHFTEGGRLKKSLHEPETGLQTALSSNVVVLHRDHFTEGGRLKLKDKTVIEVRSLHEPATGLQTALSSIVVVLHRDHFTEGGD
ncbi:hypothetical protein J6590_078338 [Homalodisca vitripennis]|nr:hypothetical protein J6590_078338 [Homalodisca vitripennis]